MADANAWITRMNLHQYCFSRVALELGLTVVIFLVSYDQKDQVPH